MYGAYVMYDDVLCEYKGTEGNSCHYILLFHSIFLLLPAISPHCYPPAVTRIGEIGS